MGKQIETYKLKRSISIFWFKPFVSDGLTHSARRMNYATQQTQSIQSTFSDIYTDQHALLSERLEQAKWHYIDYKTVGFFSKSEKKSVKRGESYARKARKPHTPWSLYFFLVYVPSRIMLGLERGTFEIMAN